MVAVERNFNNCVQLLIHSGANVNTKSPQGETVLTIPVQNGNFTAIHHLLNTGAAIDMANSLRNTALLANVGCTTIPKHSFILKVGAQMYLLHQMKTLKSDLLKLCKMGPNGIQCIQLLFKSAIVINHSNNFDENVLQYYLLNLTLSGHHYAIGCYRRSLK